MAAAVTAGAALLASALPAHAAGYSAFAFTLGTGQPDIYNEASVGAVTVVVDRVPRVLSLA